MEVTVYQNQVEKALKVLKRQMTKEGLLKELKRRRFYEKPSVKKKRKQKEIRKVIKCFMAALPIPFRTTEKQPTFFNLDDNNNCTCPSPHGRTFPTALDPMYCNRYEIRQFAKEAYALGINYLGVCCGAAPMHIREVAEAIGRVVPASRYKENMSNHFIYGTNKRIPKHISDYGEKA